MPSDYRVLGVSPYADLREIRRAYWSLSKRVRRECGADSRDDRLTEIKRAYETLSRQARRRGYDARPSEDVGFQPRRLDGSGSAGRKRDDGVMGEFPSMSAMARITPRICEAFFGRDPKAPHSTHTTHVELTRAQARRGARVPLALSVRPVCPVCGGRGELWPEPCGVCFGTGAGRLSHELQVPVPPGVRNGECLRYSVISPFAPETHVELRIAVP